MSTVVPEDSATVIDELGDSVVMIDSLPSLVANFISFLTFSISSVKMNLQGISNPHCGRSAEYLLEPVTLQNTVPPRRKNNEQIDDIFLVRVLRQFLIYKRLQQINHVDYSIRLDRVVPLHL